MNNFFIRLLGLSALLLSLNNLSAAELDVESPWVRAAPPGAPALAAFMLLHNHSDAARSLVAASTSLATSRVELHRTMLQDGVMKMVPQERIPVEPHSTTSLEPGSWHVMLIGPEQVPGEGEQVEITLVFDDGSEQRVSATVRKAMGMGMTHEHQSHGE